MILETRAAAPFFKNGYLLGCERTREGVIVDPGDEIDEVLAAAHGYGIDVKAILLTHGHVDHVSGVALARRTLGAPVCLHRDDLFLYDIAVQQGAKYGLRVEPLPPVDRFYAHGDTVPFGDYEARVLHTPGHCPGGVCLQVGPKGQGGPDLFVGDTLFAGSIGRTDLPGGDYDVLMRSIADVLLPLGDDRIVHSGHGPDTTIGEERLTNPFVRQYLDTR